MSAKTLTKIYHDPKVFRFLGRVWRPLRRAKKLHVLCVTRETVQDYIQSKQANKLRKLASRQFTRKNIYVAGIDLQWQVNLADIQVIARQNDGMTY